MASSGGDGQDKVRFAAASNGEHRQGEERRGPESNGTVRLGKARYGFFKFKKIIMTTAKADYSHGITECLGRPFIVIQDLDNGNKSVTNDMDNVLEEIATREKIDPADHLIVYRDSQKLWDGYVYRSHEFVGLRADSYQEAMDRMLDHHSRRQRLSTKQSTPS